MFLFCVVGCVGFFITVVDNDGDHAANNVIWMLLCHLVADSELWYVVKRHKLSKRNKVSTIGPHLSASASFRYERVDLLHNSLTFFYLH